MTMPRLKLLIAIALTALVCMCASNMEKTFPSKISTAVFRCNEGWCLHVSMVLPNPCYIVNYTGMSVGGKEVNVYFTCVKKSGVCAQVLTNYSKTIPLGNLTGNYTINVFVNGVKKASFAVNFT